LTRKDQLAEKISHGLEQLRQSGILPEQPSVSLVPELHSQLGKRGDVDLAIAFTLGKIPDPAAVELLSTIERDATEKELRKEARRALFKLEQRGIVVPEKADRADHGATGFFGTGTSLEAYMSAVDGGGNYLIWIAKPQMNQGLQVIQAMLQEREGLLRIAGAHMRRKELRQLAQQMKVQHGATMISIPFEFADQELYEAYERARARGRTGIEKFHELRSIVAAGKPKETAHPIYGKLDAAQAQLGAWRETSRQLLDEPELRYWILLDEWLQAYLSQLQAAQNSRLVLNSVQKEERFAAIVREAVKELCNGETGRVFRRRLENMALYFLETGRSAQANLALAVALQVGEGDPGPLDVSFLTGLVQKSFAYLLSQQKAKLAEEPSLIIKP
jgi:hypothetical protein